MKIYCFNGFQQVQQALDSGSIPQIRVEESSFDDDNIAGGFRWTDGWAKNVDDIAEKCNARFEGQAEFWVSGPYNYHEDSAEEYYLLEYELI